jgi:hypothetical protein
MTDAIGVRTLDAALWEEAKKMIRGELTGSTFAAQVAPTTFARADEARDILYLRATSHFSAEWLAARLRPVVERAVEIVADRPVDVRFLDGSAPDAEREIAPRMVVEQVDDFEGPLPDRTPRKTVGAGDVFVRSHSVDPLRGFVATSHYSARFWRPYLGTEAFALWEVLRSFAFFVERGRGEYPGLATLADVVGVDRRALTGRADRPHVPGLIDVLRRERVVRYRTRGSGPAVAHFFDVLDSLPLLAPAQVVDLSPRLVALHEEFALFFPAYDWSAWKAIASRTLIGDWSDGGA